ncbi:DUF485 domain-containing protein [Bacillus sp. 179-C3.3 HS]|uniref:DUF485 domain-containing protein n=1 Tax=Bacillus sp. 179-C3.3 HS TaxID=3232162 RepID=UPI0039A283A5
MAEKKVHYQKVAASENFRTLLEEKRRFIVPMTIFFFLFYFSLPVATSYFTFLNTPAIGAISWAWLFALMQFLMTWILCAIYARKAAQFDKYVSALKSMDARGDDE